MSLHYTLESKSERGYLQNLYQNHFKANTNELNESYD